MSAVSRSKAFSKDKALSGRTPKPAPARPEAPTADGAAARASRKAPAAKGPMRAWGNSLESYHEHQMSEFPLGARAFRWFAIALVAAYSKLMWRWQVDGRERLERATREHGVVLVMNHVSMLDPIVAYLTMVAMGRRIRPVYKAEFNSAGPLGRLISWVGGIPVRRGTADLKALRNAQRTLEAGDSIMIFPEGTRIKSDDEPVELHGGFALMARMGGADVVPMAIVGARDITPRGHRLPRPVKVWCRVGEPISFSELGVRGRKQQAEEMERVAMERVYALRDELRREHPGKM